MKTSIACIAVTLAMMGIMMVAQANESNVLPVEGSSLSSILNVDESGKVVDFIKSYPVSKIQPGLTTVPHHTLPEIPLEKWLTSVMGGATLKWEGGDCAAHDSDNDDNDEHCVSYLVAANTPKERCPSMELKFIVNQDAKVHLMYEGSEVNDFGARGGLEQLADLEKVLSNVKAKRVPNRPSSQTIGKLRARKGTDIALYAAGLDVHRFDPSLPPERFDKWLERSTGWTFQWMSYPAYFHHCSFTPLEVYARPIVDAEKQSPPVSISMNLGTWEEEIKGEPKLLYKSRISVTLSASNNHSGALLSDARQTHRGALAQKYTAHMPSPTSSKPTRSPASKYPI